MSLLQVRVRTKKDIEANWISSNPILLDGEMAISTDKGNRYKVGDGTSTWSALSYNEIGATSEELAVLEEEITKLKESRPNWNQNDSTAPDYVENRTHYEDIIEVPIIENFETIGNYPTPWGGEGRVFVSDVYDTGVQLIENKQYKVVYDGIGYLCTAHYNGYQDNIYLGNEKYIEYGKTDNGLPFIMLNSYKEHGEMYDFSIGVPIPEDGSEYITAHTVSIYAIESGDIKQLDEKFIPETIARVSELGSNWNQNDENAVDYVKNRTHWVDINTIPFLEEMTFEDTYSSLDTLEGISCDESNTDKLIVTLDGVVYEVGKFTYYSDPMTGWGDSRIMPWAEPDIHPVDVPFLITASKDYGMFGTGEENVLWTINLTDEEDGSSHTLKIDILGDVSYHTLDENFIPDTIARTEYVDEKINTHNESTDAHNDIRESINNKQDKTLIVRLVDTRVASHTPAEVLEYFQSGGNVVFFDGGTEHPFLEGDSDTSIFYSSYISSNKIQATVYELLSDKSITGNRYEYTPPAPTGAASTIISSNLTKDRALISNGSGKVAVSDITSTELGYLDGVTSNIQTQLNSKVPTTLTVNGKALSSNITLSASDVGSYSKADIDSMVFITVEDIDTICGATIQSASDVEF